MKIFMKDVVYVQKNDLAFLSSMDLSVPASIFLKVFGNGITIINDDNRYEFIKFEDKNEIEYFKKIDWIIDYDSVKDLNEEQIMDLALDIVNEKNKIAEVFNPMSTEEKEKNRHMYFRAEMLDFKLMSLRDIIWFKRGKLKIKLPNSVESPEKGFKKLLRKFRKK